MDISGTSPFAPPREGRLHIADAVFRDAGDNVIPTHSGENCRLCIGGPDIAFSMAFQPIVDVATGTVFAYEALTRGPAGEPATTVLSRTLHNNKYSMDQRCREKAITISAGLGILETGADLSINFFPNAVYEPRQCLRRTLAAANAVGFPLERIIFEITEVEEVRSHDHLRSIMTEYQARGLRIAIDDFGAGHSGLTMLSVFQPDIIKIDMALVRGIDQRPASRAIVRSIAQICTDLNIQMIAEGIEHESERDALRDLGIDLMQGYYFARPAFEALPLWPRRP
jgi:EAL domain-containing protein (putative c-di-GMP-specific phosphodiesterase class I)